MTDQTTKRLQGALKILADFEVPTAQQNDRSALTLLAMADLRPTRRWKTACRPLRRITEIIDWISRYHDVTYAPNTRETIRRQTIHQFVQMGIVVQNPDDPDRPINSPHWCYQLSDSALNVLQNFGKPAYRDWVTAFLDLPTSSSLKARSRNLPQQKVKLPGSISFTITVNVFWGHTLSNLVTNHELFSNMNSNTKEIALEQAIEQHLTGTTSEAVAVGAVATGAWQIGEKGDFSARLASDARFFWRFLEMTQEQELAKLKQRHIATLLWQQKALLL